MPIPQNAENMETVKIPCICTSQWPKSGFFIKTAQMQQNRVYSRFHAETPRSELWYFLEKTIYASFYPLLAPHSVRLGVSDISRTLYEYVIWMLRYSSITFIGYKERAVGRCVCNISMCVWMAFVVVIFIIDTQFYKSKW